MKPTPRPNIRSPHDVKYDILHLQKENANLRSEMKFLNTRLNEMIQSKDLKHSKKESVQANPEEELKELQKMLGIYVIEKKSLSKRLKKALDLDYCNNLQAKIEESQEKINMYEASKKNSQLHDKKENLYKHSPSKPVDITSEITYLSSKIGYYKEKIYQLENSLEKNKKTISETLKKCDSLEKEYESQIDGLGESYFKDIHMKKLLEQANNKKHIEKIIQKESSTKSALLLQKVKTLQAELSSLRETESTLNHRLLESYKKIEVFSIEIKNSPISFEKTLKIDNRSRSVKPFVRKPQANGISYF